MNKGKKNLSKRTQKKMQKEVRKGMMLGPEYPAPEIKRVLPKTKELLQKEPKRKAAIESSHLASLEMSMTRKKSKRQKKHSKRTDPQDAVVNSVPAHVHSEGARWMKTIVKQNKIQRKRLSKKINKRK